MSEWITNSRITNTRMVFCPQLYQKMSGPPNPWEQETISQGQPSGVTEGRYWHLGWQATDMKCSDVSKPWRKIQTSTNIAEQMRGNSCTKARITDTRILFLYFRLIPTTLQWDWVTEQTNMLVYLRLKHSVTGLISYEIKECLNPKSRKAKKRTRGHWDKAK